MLPSTFIITKKTSNGSNRKDKLDYSTKRLPALVTLQRACPPLPVPVTDVAVTGAGKKRAPVLIPHEAGPHLQRGIGLRSPSQPLTTCLCWLEGQGTDGAWVRCSHTKCIGRTWAHGQYPGRPFLCWARFFHS